VKIIKKSTNPYRNKRQYRFYYLGSLLKTKYCSEKEALQEARQLEGLNWLKVNSILVTT